MGTPKFSRSYGVLIVDCAPDSKYNNKCDLVVSRDASDLVVSRDASEAPCS